MEKLLKVSANFNIMLGCTLVLIPVLLLAYFNLGPRYQVLAAFQPERESELLVQNIFDGERGDVKQGKYTFADPFTTTSTKIKPLTFIVPENKVTTTGANIQISDSGLSIDTQIFESQNASLALDSGVWRDPTQGTPDNNTLPVVLAAHRWGENNLSWDYRNKNLFTEFDKLKGGEIVTINWNNVAYKYKVTFVEQNSHVTRSGDLIMYTCIDYTSVNKIIVYAELVK
ncbi:MAG: sortase [Candidatus Dojkabacteria bacterium]